MKYKIVEKIISHINSLTEMDVKDKGFLYFSLKTGKLLHSYFNNNRRDDIFVIKINEKLDYNEKQKCIKKIKEEWAHRESLIGLSHIEKIKIFVDRLSDNYQKSDKEIGILKRLELNHKLNKIKDIKN